MVLVISCVLPIYSHEPNEAFLREEGAELAEAEGARVHNKFTARFKKSAKSTVAQAPPPVSDGSPLSEGAYDYIRTKNGGSEPPPYQKI